MKTIIQTALAPRPIGAYSQAVVVDDVVYLSGQIAIDPATGELVGQTFEEQIKQVFLNMAAVLSAAGGELSQIVKLTIYLKNFAEDYPKLNEGMVNFFFDNYPARTTIGVSALPKNALVEIDAVVSLKN